ncbi:MAG: hypothetical protein V7775_11950 [Sulfitobacter sp.]
MVGSEDIRLAVSVDAEAITEMLAYPAKDMGDRAAFASTPEAIRKFGFGPRPLFSVLIASGAGLCPFFSHFSTTRGCPWVYGLRADLRRTLHEGPLRVLHVRKEHAPKP